MGLGIRMHIFSFFTFNHEVITMLKPKRKYSDKHYNMFLEIQRYLYDTLKKNKNLAQDLRIFNQIPEGTPYPYLYLGKFSVVNRSLKGSFRMHFVNELHLYSQEFSTEDILEWINEIKRSIVGYKIQLENTFINEVNFIQTTLDVLPDGATYKAIMKFRLIAEEGNGSTTRLFNAA